MKEIIEQFERAGIRLAAAGDKLRLAPKSRLTPELLELARQHKAELLAMLTGRPAVELNPPAPDNIDPTVRAEISRIESEAVALGWPQARLWNSAFWPAPRGLAAVLDGSDRIAEVTRECILIQKADGNQQRFFRFDG